MNFLLLVLLVVLVMLVGYEPKGGWKFGKAIDEHIKQDLRRKAAAEAQRRSMNQRGMFLLELAIGMLVMAILLAMAMPNVLKLRAIENQVRARKRVETIMQAQADVALCAGSPTCNPNSVIAAQGLVPPAGSMSMSGYTFTMAQAGLNWTYTAIPSAQQGYQAYFVDQTGVMRCAPLAVSQSSPVCN